MRQQGKTYSVNGPFQDFVQEISVSKVSVSSPVALQQGLKKDFDFTFISVSSGSLEQALSRETHGCSWFGDCSSDQTVSPRT